MDYKRYLAGGLSGIIEVITTHPIDYIKTKKQEYIQTNKEITPKFYKEITDGKFINSYRGVVPRILGVVPMRLIFSTHFMYFNDFTDMTCSENSRTCFVF